MNDLCVCVCVRCEAGYGGSQCDQLLDFNILYVVPSGQKLHYVLIAAIIGAVQIAVIVAVVMCFTRYSHHSSSSSCSSMFVSMLKHFGTNIILY